MSLREQARYLDNNHDLVIGVFDKLEERVVGEKRDYCRAIRYYAMGPLPVTWLRTFAPDGVNGLFSPEVTGQFTRPMLERLMLRTWLRDGEVFAQMVSGRIKQPDAFCRCSFLAGGARAGLYSHDQ
ncbi:phage portal protein [Escherichia coli]